MSDVLWTDDDRLTLERAQAHSAAGFACSVAIEEKFSPLTPDECDSLAAALVQAAAKKRSEDRVRQLEQEGKVQP